MGITLDKILVLIASDLEWSETTKVCEVRPVGSEGQSSDSSTIRTYIPISSYVAHVEILEILLPR